MYLRRGHILALEDDLGELNADLGVVDDEGNLAYEDGQHPILLSWHSSSRDAARSQMNDMLRVPDEIGCSYVR